MQTRCPAWCDRVLLSHTAKQLIVEDENVEYGLMGQTTCMGDHKVSVEMISLNAAVVFPFFIIYAASFSGFSHVDVRIRYFC